MSLNEAEEHEALLIDGLMIQASEREEDYRRPEADLAQTIQNMTIDRS